MNPSTANLSPNQKSAILLLSVSPEVAAEALKLRSPEEVAAVPVQAHVSAECLDYWSIPSAIETSSPHSTISETRPIEAVQRAQLQIVQTFRGLVALGKVKFS